MDTVRLLLMAIVGIGLIYVVLPIMADVYFRFRRPRVVRCPENGLAAEVQVDAWHAAATAIPGPPGQHVADCSRWPEHARCKQDCLSHATAR